MEAPDFHFYQIHCGRLHLSMKIMCAFLHILWEKFAKRLMTTQGLDIPRLAVASRQTHSAVTSVLKVESPAGVT
jgi:hypothetical protein